MFLHNRIALGNKAYTLIDGGRKIPHRRRTLDKCITGVEAYRERWEERRGNISLSRVFIFSYVIIHKTFVIHFYK